MKKILLSLCLTLLAVCGICGIAFGFGGSGGMETAYAATYTTPKYLTYGTTSTGSSSTSGCPSNFKIYMHGSSTSGTGTMYHDKLIDWSYVYIKIEVNQISDHLSFKLKRNGSTYSSKTLSGNANMTLYSGALSDGEYELEYQGRYRKNIFYSYTTYTYTYRFEVDKTSPSYTLKAGNSTISSGSYTNKQVVYTASDKNFDAIRYLRPNSSSYSTTYSTSYTIPASDSNNGWWYFYARDYLGTTNSTVSVYMDTIAPVGKFTSNGSTVSNGGYTNKSFYYTATDAGGVSYLQYKKPNSSTWTSYTSGTSISGTNGTYTFRAVDKAGNISAESKITYDTATPSATLYSGTTSVSSGAYSKANYVKFSVSDSTAGISSAYVKLPGSSYYSTYTSGSQLTDEGVYTFYAVDKAGNSTAYYTITLDKSKPTGTLYAGTNVVSSGTFTNASYIRFVPSDAVSGVSSIYVMKPGTSSYVTYTSGAQLTATGTYKFYATDRSGNQSDIYTITIDHSAPSAQLYSDDKPVSNGSYTNGSHIRFASSDTNLKNAYVKLPGETNFVDYSIGTEYYKEGKYTFYAIDAAGLSTGNYTIVIDRTNKPLTFNNVENGTTNGDVTITWTDGNPDKFAPVKTVTVNGKPYAKNSVIHTIDTGKYEVVCTDAAGNVWTGSFASTAVNVVTRTLQKEFWEATDAEGTPFSFENYDNAFAFACEREKSFVRTGIWQNDSWDTGIPMDEKDATNAQNGTYFIYKKSGEPNAEVAYFTQDRLDEVIAEYAKVGIESYFYWQKDHAEEGSEQNLYRYSDGKTILANSIAFHEGVTFMVDGEIVSGLVYETEGRHELIVEDAYGNQCSYNLIVVRDVPTIEYAVGEGAKNTVVFDREYRLKDKATVTISDEFDEMAMFGVYDEDGGLLAYLNLDQSYLFEESGKYTVRAVNHAGETSDFVLYISLDAPKIKGEENKADKRFTIDITDSEDKYSGLLGLTIYKSTNGGDTWEPLTADDYGTPISTDTLTYNFCTSGRYRVVLTDAFRTGIDAIEATFDYEQPAPDGILEGVENGGYTNTDVSFTWTDEATVTLTKDGEPVEYKSGERLKEDGVYRLVFENRDGYKSVYDFVIDKTAPALSVEGAENGGATNTDVTATIPESGLKTELYINGELVGEYESGTVLSADGSYRIVVTDKANNITEAAFVIDKHVDFSAPVTDNLPVNEVTFTAGEDLTITLTKDGESVSYDFGDTITEDGTYTAVIADELGNSETISFTVIKPLVRTFSHDFGNVKDLEKIFVNGLEMRLENGVLSLGESGEYTVVTVVKGKDFSFTVTVDNTAPAAVLGGVENGGQTKGGVTVDELSETADVKVYLDGSEIEYKLGDELTENGSYRVVLTDACGNTTEYTFEILYSMNATAIILIVLGILLLAGGITAVVVLRRKGKFGKKNKNDKAA